MAKEPAKSKRNVKVKLASDGKTYMVGKENADTLVKAKRATIVK